MKTVDKFGHYRGLYGRPGPPGIGFILNAQGNYDMQNKTLTNVGDPAQDHDAVTKQFLYGRMNLFLEYAPRKNAYDCLNRRVGDLRAPETGQDAVNLEYLQKKLNETILLDSEKKTFNAGGRTISNVGKANEGLEAVNLNLLNESLKKTLQIDASNNFDVGNRQLCNVADPQGSNDAVSRSYLKAWLHIHGYIMQRELTDAVISLRKEIHTNHKARPNSSVVMKQLNGIEDSFKRTWRSAVFDEGKAKPPVFTELDKTQFNTNFGIDKKVLDSYLEENFHKI